MLGPLTLRVAIVGAALGLFGCEAEYVPTAPGRYGGDGGSRALPNGGTSVPESAFTYGGELTLLPFDIRLAKVARLAGVSSDDALLDGLRLRRFELGDHDYAHGIKADGHWTTSKMATWVKALEPVCASEAMRKRFPALPEGLDAFVLAAYGRHATDDDRRLVDEALASSAIDTASRYRVTCLGIVTSLELVAR